MNRDLATYLIICALALILGGAALQTGILKPAAEIFNSTAARIKDAGDTIP